MEDEKARIQILYICEHQTNPQGNRPFGPTAPCNLGCHRELAKDLNDPSIKIGLQGMQERLDRRYLELRSEERRSTMVYGMSRSLAAQSYRPYASIVDEARAIVDRILSEETQRLAAVKLPPCAPDVEAAPREKVAATQNDQKKLRPW